MKKILCIIQLPPPLHGVSMMNSHVVNISALNKDLHMEIIDLKFGKSIQQLEKFSLNKVITALRYCFVIIKKMRSYKPHLVYFTLTPTGFAFYRDALYIYILKFFKAKIIVHLHGKGIKNHIGNPLKKKLYKSVFNKIYVICLSETLSKDISDIYKGTPFIVHNGIQVPKDLKIKNAPGEIPVPRLLFLSNYIENKGILVLVEALGILKTKGYRFTARFVGAPSNVTNEMLQEQIDKLDLTHNTEVVGPKHGDEKYIEFQNADIFVFPTYNDSFPLVTLEAMQFSLPVVSTFEGSIPDIVNNNETGYLVERQNTQMLADKIGLLLNDKDLRISMGKKGYEKFLNNYTLQHFESNMLKTFKTVLSYN